MSSSDWPPYEIRDQLLVLVLNVPLRSARSFIIAKKTGTRINTWIVEVIMPPTIGAAIGFMTSELNPLSHRDWRETQHHHRDRHQFRPKALHRAFDRCLLDVLDWLHRRPAIFWSRASCK